MKIIRNSCEEEMILEFLKGEINSKRFNQKLYDILKELNISSEIITNGDINSDGQNKLRLKIMNKFRGYPDRELFENFPKIYEWKYVQFDLDDLDNIYYIDYDYWNELSNRTSKLYEAAKNIKNGIEIYDVSNKPFIDGMKFLDDDKFPAIILITCNGEKNLVIEGHSRITIYGLRPEKFVNSFGFIGYCTEEEMEKYDLRMI